MRRFRTTIVLAISTLLFISICAAQQAPTTSIPNLIRYSGTLKDGQGATLSSSTAVGVTFSVYKQQDGGAAVWMETQNVTPDANGQYNVVLGSTTATGLPDDLFSQQEQRWLGVQVQGQAEQARVLLVSVPYAFKAHEAETLGGLPASAFAKAPMTDGSSSEAAGTAVNALSKGGKAGGTADSAGIRPKTVSDCLGPKLGAITLWSKQIQTSPPIWELCNSNLFQVVDPASPYFGNIGIGAIPNGPSEPLDVLGVISTYQWYDINEQRIVSVNNTGAASSGSTNLFVGWGAGSTNTGDTNNNTFAGRESGFFNNSGSFGSFYGYRSGYHNTNGNSNTLVGYQAGFQNSHGSNNTYVGRSSGFLSTGSGNVCVGYAACYKNTASNNSFLGFNSGNANTTGAGNTFVGNQAGSANTVGGGNTFIGNNAGLTSVDPSGANCCNTLVGNGAGAIGPMAGGGNSCVGHRTCEAMTSGGKNTASGFLSGYKTTTGSFNSYYGDQSGQNNISGNYNTFLGISAGGTAFTLGDYNTFVGAFAGNNENNVTNNIEIGNPGPAPHGSNSILIGVEAAGMKETYIAGIYQQTSLTGTRPVVVDVNGHLGTGTGGGNVVGPPSPCTTNYLTRWAGGYNTDCTHEYELQTNFYLGVNVGTTPQAALDVNGQTNSGINTTDTRSAYMIGLNPVLSVNALGNNNLFVGVGAGLNNPANTGTGTDNTFSGFDAGFNATGRVNTFSGSGAGYGATTGFNNTGDANTFSGYEAGYFNTTGSYNTFSGYLAGYSSTSGRGNTFFGFDAGIDTADTSENTCLGDAACHQNIGSSNVCVGSASCYANQGGNNNTEIGTGAGVNFHGNNDIFVGYNAGFYSTLGDANIYVGSQGSATLPHEGNVIRIGNFLDSNYTKQNQVFIEPILANPTMAQPLVSIDATGKLGVQGSSRRFKENIADMGDSSGKLFQLRPVTFFYKRQYDDGSHRLQYGLIAEEVAKVYPEMVAYDNQGQPFTVLYQMLAPILLNELQKQHSIIAAQHDDLQTQLQQIKAQRQEIDGLKRQLQLQSASLQERLQKLESYVETQMKTASDNPPRTTPGANGGLQ